MPKCQVIDTAFTWGDDRPPQRPWHESVIYELHVRGFTMRHPDVPEHLRGTFAGLATPAAIDYLHQLGITAVELLPVHAFLNDRHLVERGLTNYWGYNTLSFFAPEPRYLPTDAGEFKAFVQELHDAGIEVILDVVYNHTAEGNQLGPTLSFRGIDNASYYRLVPGNERYYMDFTGCGNALDLRHPRVLQLVMDSLRYWVEEMHVDGFRFDLATTLARERRLRSALGLPRRHAPGSGALAGQADRRAVGRGRRRLPAGRVPGRLGGVERPVPRHRAAVLEGRRGESGARVAHHRLERHLRSTAGGPGRASTS